MYYTKRFCLSLFIILLIISLYNDFSKSSLSPIQTNSEHISRDVDELTVIKVKIQPGETVLSISERINGDKLKNVTIDEIIADFLSVNPNVKLHELSPTKYYYFPMY